MIVGAFFDGFIVVDPVAMSLYLPNRSDSFAHPQSLPILLSFTLWFRAFDDEAQPSRSRKNENRRRFIAGYARFELSSHKRLFMLMLVISHDH
jgi:hypothetical protein